MILQITFLYDRASLVDWIGTSKVGIGISKVGGGNILFVQEPIEKGETLFIVPRDHCMTIDHAKKDKQFGSTFEWP